MQQRHEARQGKMPEFRVGDVMELSMVRLVCRAGLVIHPRTRGGAMRASE
jgi:hypothetical protein